MSGFMVNKLVVDIDRKFNNQIKIISFVKYEGKQLKYKYMDNFIEVVYRNFEYLDGSILLNHTRESIESIIFSDTSVIILAMLKDYIVGYLIADIIDTQSTKMMHIYYLYTAPIHRGNGIATHMLNIIQKYTLELNIYMLSLVVDTYNKALVKFYMDNHYYYDTRFRSFKRYDNFVKYI